MIQIEHNGSTFQFNRDTTGKGYWVCTKGKCPGLTGGVIHNVAVPIVFQQELRVAAIAAGYKSEDFQRSVKVEEKKEKTVRVRGARRSKKPRGISLDD